MHVLFSTLRLRLYDFAYNTDLLPLADPRRGRVALSDLSKPDELVDVMRSLIDLGARLAPPERLLHTPAT